MAKTAINLYSVRELDIGMLDLLDRVADAGYDGVQFSGGLRGEDPDAVAEKLDETELEPTGAHIDIEELEGDLAGTHERYVETLGCASAVVPYLDDERFASIGAVEDTVEELSALVADTNTYDWPLHYHNHAHELADVDGRTGLDRLAGIDDLGIELDVGWALIGGGNPVELIDTYGDWIELLHMKDMDVKSEEFREIGDGDVDMAECAAAGREADVKWLIYEHDQPADPTASIRTGSEFLHSL